MRGNVLVDLRNVYDPAEAQKERFAYFGIGRGRFTADEVFQRGPPHLKTLAGTRPSEELAVDQPFFPWLAAVQKNVGPVIAAPYARPTNSND